MTPAPKHARIKISDSSISGASVVEENSLSGVDVTANISK